MRRCASPALRDPLITTCPAQYARFIFAATLGEQTGFFSQSQRRRQEIQAEHLGQALFD